MRAPYSVVDTDFASLASIDFIKMLRQTYFVMGIQYSAFIIWRLLKY